jgi:hypothetical protein
MKELNCLLLSAVLGAGSLIPVVTLFDTVHTLFAGKEQIVSLSSALQNSFITGIILFIMAFVAVIVYGFPVYYFLKKINKLNIFLIALFGVIPSFVVPFYYRTAAIQFIFMLVCCLTVSLCTYLLMIRLCEKKKTKELDIFS